MSTVTLSQCKKVASASGTEDLSPSSVLKDSLSQEGSFKTFVTFFLENIIYTLYATFTVLGGLVNEKSCRVEELEFHLIVEP